ncbi:MAG: DUF2231 domain-containing protein [Gemmatimonadota bacterium]
MRSRANFRTHPIHPMLVAFPLAFLVGGFLADIGSLVFDSVDLRVTAWYLLAAGVLAGVIAAIPGLIDYFSTVPPDSSAKQRATRHMIVNVTAIALFAGAWWLRGGPAVPPDLALLGAEAIGVVLLTFGGWMGGTLVYRNQIGVDHRYARAGKWSEAHIEADSSGSTTVARTDELEVDQMKLLHIGGRRVVLARVEDRFVAFSDHCTHKGGSLAGGVMACGRVVCPWHGSQFDVSTGTACAGPAEHRIETFDVEVVGHEVRVSVSRRPVPSGGEED